MSTYYVHVNCIALLRYAFVEFSHKREAQGCVRANDGLMINQRVVKLQVLLSAPIRGLSVCHSRASLSVRQSNTSSPPQEYHNVCLCLGGKTEANEIALNARQARLSQPSAPNNEGCFKCGDPTHWARKCPMIGNTGVGPQPLINHAHGELRTKRQQRTESKRLLISLMANFF